MASGKLRTRRYRNTKTGDVWTLEYWLGPGGWQYRAVDAKGKAGPWNKDMNTAIERARKIGAKV